MQKGTVRVSGLNLRKSLTTGTVIKKLRKNSRVTILGTETWHRVRTRDGKEGVVFGDFVEIDHEPTAMEAAGGGVLETALGAAAEALAGTAAEAAAGAPAEDAAPAETVAGAAAGTVARAAAETVARAAVEEAGGAAEATVSTTLRLQSYQNDRFIGNVATVDADLVPHLDRIARFAEECELKVFVTSSLRDPRGGISNAIVTPAKGSNHFVGHAIDMNLQLDSGDFFNSSKLKKLADQPRNVRDFIKKVQDDPELRWGGDFRTPDVVHIDDGLNLRQPDVWKAKFESRG